MPRQILVFLTVSAILALPSTTLPQKIQRLDQRISQTRGAQGGTIILWPRVIPASQNPAIRDHAFAIRDRLRRLAGQVFPGRALESRPEPQRSCPHSGCRAMRLGAVLLHRGQGCAVVVTMGRPGQSSTRLVPWMGKVGLKKSFIAFRDKPETSIQVLDFVPCQQLLKPPPEGTKLVMRAIKETGQRTP